MFSWIKLLGGLGIMAGLFLSGMYVEYRRGQANYAEDLARELQQRQQEEAERMGLIKQELENTRFREIQLSGKVETFERTNQHLLDSIRRLKPQLVAKDAQGCNHLSPKFRVCFNEAVTGEIDPAATCTTDVELDVVLGRASVVPVAPVVRHYRG